MSVVDPQARHAHKSRASYHDGFKSHIAVAPKSGLITANTVTAGDAADGGGATPRRWPTPPQPGEIKPLPLPLRCPTASTATTSPSTTRPGR